MDTSPSPSPMDWMGPPAGAGVAAPPQAANSTLATTSPPNNLAKNLVFTAFLLLNFDCLSLMMRWRNNALCGANEVYHLPFGQDSQIADDKSKYSDFRIG